MEKIFLNDRLVDADKAFISAGDSAFLYGVGLFETMRCHNGVVFSIKDHLDRLLYSAAALSIRHPYPRRKLVEAVGETLRANGLKEARVRLTLSADATLLVTAVDFQRYPPDYYSKGVLVVICPYRQSPTDPVCGHKTTSYFPRMLGLDAARRRTAAEALWFTCDNRLAEGCVSNVFLVKNSAVYTPPVNTPVLSGVARKTVCRIAFDKGVDLVEKDLYIDDCLDADECFITNVIMKVMPVNAIEGHTVGDGRVGPVTTAMLRYFDQELERQCQPEAGRLEEA